MKKAVFFILLAMLTVDTFAQNTSYEQLKREEMKYNENTSHLNIELIGQEAFNGGDVQFRVVIGDDKQFYIKDKSDGDLMEQLREGVRSFNSIPDALDYLNDKGFKLDFYSTVIFQENIRHYFLLSKTTML